MKIQLPSLMPVMFLKAELILQIESYFKSGDSINVTDCKLTSGSNVYWIQDNNVVVDRLEYVSYDDLCVEDLYKIASKIQEHQMSA